MLFLPGRIDTPSHDGRREAILSALGGDAPPCIAATRVDSVVAQWDPDRLVNLAGRPIGHEAVAFLAHNTHAKLAARAGVPAEASRITVLRLLDQMSQRMGADWADAFIEAFLTRVEVGDGRAELGRSRLVAWALAPARLDRE